MQFGNVLVLLAGVWARPPTRPGEGVEGSGGGQVRKASVLVSRKHRGRWGRRDMEMESGVSSQVGKDHAET